MNKLDREVRRALSKLSVEVVQRRGNGGHTRLTVRLPTGAERTLTMANSPTNMEHTINNVVRDVRRLINPPSKGISP